MILSYIASKRIHVYRHFSDFGIEISSIGSASWTLFSENFNQLGVPFTFLLKFNFGNFNIAPCQLQPCYSLRIYCFHNLPLSIFVKILLVFTAQERNHQVVISKKNMRLFLVTIYSGCQLSLPIKIRLYTVLLNVRMNHYVIISDERLNQNVLTRGQTVSQQACESFVHPSPRAIHPGGV